jgi:uncharacterized protein YggE
MNEFFSKGYGKALLVLVIIFLGVQAAAGLLNLRYIGAGIAAANTISVSGHGEFFAAPDIATFNYSIVSDKPTVAAAQADATAKANDTTAYLKSAGIDAKDIQTSGYSVYPQYEYQNATCPAVAPAPNGSASSPVYCPPGKQVLTGYEARQTTTVKVRDLAKAGDLLAGVGSKGATEVSGLQFTFDDPNAPQNQARDKAIADARSKAEVLAKELGVSLVRVTSFSENSGGNYPRPYALDAQAAGSATKASAPEISPGQNQVTDDVNVTYEIR